ncbi:MAG: RnfABCDGE type electron transport complex subunit D [Bacteroidales bacterium]|nr:RnfABCDGE type electron transport complex subunit D [Bacteroidales bacterium]
MSNLFTISPSPHFKSKTTTSSLMFGVLIALAPAFLFSLYFFGIGALITTLVSVVSCVLFEYLITKYFLKQKPHVCDGSAILTGVLLAFNLPSNISPFIVIFGALIAIGIAKMCFGGLGCNLFNPALVARVFLLISFPVQMTTWPVPIESRTSYLDAVTGATPMALIKGGQKAGDITTIANLPSFNEMFLGSIGGSLGEVAAIALILGGVYMIIRKIITWHIPVTIIATVFIFGGLCWLINPVSYINPIYHILGGGLLLGAIFMATDYVTSPMSNFGKIIFGVGIGIITIIIRNWGSYPEGMSFAILIMNAFVPIINRKFKPTRFGAKK